LDHACRPWVTTLAGLAAPNFNGGTQILDQILKNTPISDCLSNKGCLSVERPRRFSGERKKKKKNKERNFCCKI